MMAGCLFDNGCYNCGWADDCSWAAIGRIKMDKDSEAMPTEGNMPKPKDSLDWIKERLSKDEYRGYLIGKIFEHIYFYVHANQSASDLDYMDLYIRLLEND